MRGKKPVAYQDQLMREFAELPNPGHKLGSEYKDFLFALQVQRVFWAKVKNKHLKLEVVRLLESTICDAIHAGIRAGKTYHETYQDLGHLPGYSSGKHLNILKGYEARQKTGTMSPEVAG